MYNIRPTTKFQKDLKRVKKRGFDISLLTDIIKKLAAGAVSYTHLDVYKRQLRGSRCQRRTGSTNFPGIIRGVVSATLRRIGC